MHTTTKDTDRDGVHILTSTIEADGPGELVSAKGEVKAEVISVQRTDSGGIQVQTAVKISEPVPEVVPVPEPPAPEPTPEEQANAYLTGKGLSAEDAAAAVAKYGVRAVLIKQKLEHDRELDALLAEK